MHSPERESMKEGPLGPSFFLIVSLVFSITPLSPPTWAQSDPVRIACEPSLSKLVRKWSVSSSIPVVILGNESSPALREAAALNVDFAIILGEITQGEKSLLSVRTRSLPSIQPLGWEVPRFIAKTGTERDPVEWSTFKEVLRGATQEIGNFSHGWRSTGPSAALQSRFLPSHERERREVIGYKQLSLEALVLKEVMQGDAGLGLVYSLKTANPEVEVIPMEISGEIVLPEEEDIRKERYPLAQKIQMITCKGRNLAPSAAQFSEFVAHATGQAILEQAGYFPYGEPDPIKVLSGGVTPVDR